MEHLKRIIDLYEKWVVKNQDIVSEFETASKFISLLVGGQISNYKVVSEFLYASSNIIEFYNDQIIERSKQKTLENKIHSFNFNDGSVKKPNYTCHRIKLLLTTMEYSEVFFEISARHLFGNKGKWIFIILLQLTKAVARLFILKHSREQIITSPSIPSVKRKKLPEEKKMEFQRNVQLSNQDINTNNYFIKLNRSGRIIRTVDGALEKEHSGGEVLDQFYKTYFQSSPNYLLYAEYLYIAKPLIHLAGVRLFGSRSWKQYMTAFMTDMTSIYIYRKYSELMNKEQKLELSKRCINLIFYLLRSPFYDKYTEKRIKKILTLLSKIPLVGNIADSIKDNLPHYQTIYFYLWST